MNDMKCPICNDGKIIINLDGTYECDNSECSIYNGTQTETFEALIRTRKALDVALDWLEQVATPEKCDDDLCREFTKRKLAEIKTALEQKDVK